MDSFYITDKGSKYIDRLNSLSQEEVVNSETLLEDVTVLGTIDRIDGEVFKILKEEDFKSVVRRLFEAGYIDKE